MAKVSPVSPDSQEQPVLEAVKVALEDLVEADLAEDSAEEPLWSRIPISFTSFKADRSIRSPRVISESSRPANCPDLRFNFNLAKALLVAAVVRVDKVALVV